MTYQETLKSIKSLSIQGAEGIAIAATKAFAEKLKEKDPKKLKKYQEELCEARATEPALRNSLQFCMENYEKYPDVAKKVIDHFKKSKQKIAKYGAEKIESGMTIFTHCHSSTVMAVLKEARKQGKKFKVHNTETRPRFQGRITAEELAKEGVEVHHFIDSAGRIALKKADLFLFGCDAITSDGQIINKIGTEVLLNIANQYDIPSYSCTNSWKFDPKTIYGANEEIEQRDPSEVWKKPPKNVVIHNPAFEPVSPDLMTGMITELGVFKPEALMGEIQKAYPWIIE